jgi:hypothetical protein
MLTHDTTDVKVGDGPLPCGSVKKGRPLGPPLSITCRTSILLQHHQQIPLVDLIAFLEENLPDHAFLCNRSQGLPLHG